MVSSIYLQFVFNFLLAFHHNHLDLFMKDQMKINLSVGCALTVINFILPKVALIAPIFIIILRSLKFTRFCSLLF
jgi:hypothetical protein